MGNLEHSGTLFYDCQKSQKLTELLAKILSPKVCFMSCFEGIIYAHLNSKQTYQIKLRTFWSLDPYFLKESFLVNHKNYENIIILHYDVRHVSKTT